MMTTDDLVQIWGESRHGKTNAEIARGRSMTESAVGYAIRKIRAALQTNESPKFASYREAVKIIRQKAVEAEKHVQEATPPPAMPPTFDPKPETLPELIEVSVPKAQPKQPDAYVALDAAMDHLRVAIENVIQSEVDRRYGKLIDTAKISNWTTNLKRKLEG